MLVCLNDECSKNPLDINIGWSWSIDVGDHTAVYISRREKK